MPLSSVSHPQSLNNSDIIIRQIFDYREAMGCGGREGREREREGCWGGSNVGEGGSGEGRRNHPRKLGGELASSRHQIWPLTIAGACSQWPAGPMM